MNVPAPTEDKSDDTKVVSTRN